MSGVMILSPLSIGCSFSFEGALLDVDLDVRHISQGRNVPMYETNIPTNPAGKFNGNLVVSMRPFSAADAITSVQVSAGFSRVHGAPVHIGSPQHIGINDLSKPDFGRTCRHQGQRIPGVLGLRCHTSGRCEKCQITLFYHPRPRVHAHYRR